MGHLLVMLIELYIDALLADKVLADDVWELWNAGLLPDEVAAWAWCILALTGSQISRASAKIFRT